MSLASQVLRSRIANLERDRRLLNRLGCGRTPSSGCRRSPVRPPACSSGKLVIVDREDQPG